MGEHARLKATGEEIKIGTCEDLYYLRYDQVGLVAPIPNSLDPADPAIHSIIRFRFPWPDEDGQLPGEYADYARAICAPGLVPPPDLDHQTLQFRADAGFLLSLPCPEGPAWDKALPVHRNGYRGAVLLTQQKHLADGRLVPVCQCGGCGAKYRVESPDEIAALAAAFRADADRRARMGAHNGTSAADRAWCDAVAARILDSQEVTP